MWESDYPFCLRSATTKLARENVSRASSQMSLHEWIIITVTQGQGKEGIEIYNPLTLKPFQIGSPASRHAIKRGCWGGCDMPRSFGNKKIFLVAKHSGKWNDSPQRLSTCSPSKRWDGNMGFICKEEAGVRVGGLAGCVEWTAVMSGRKRGFRNASLSPLCLIIWMASPHVTQRQLYRSCRGY